MARNKYSERLRLAMKTRNNPTGHEVTIRNLEKLMGYSYEHIRKIVHGEPFASRDFNEAICKLLGLPEEEMWQLAQEEKLAKKYGTSMTIRLPHDERLEELWPKLTETDHERVIRIMEGMAMANEALAETHTTGKAHRKVS